MEIFIGLDVSLASTSVCALNVNGETVNGAKVPSDPGSLVAPLAADAGTVLSGSGFVAAHAQESVLDVPMSTCSLWRVRLPRP